MILRRTRKDYQVSTGGLVFAAHQLADRSNGINDGRTGRVGHETLQWLYNASARWFTRKRKQVSLSGLETGDRGL
jgi:hypothetical protein